jgi:hypothetical protein
MGMAIIFVFGKKFPGEERKCEMVHCCDATASSIVPTVQVKSSHIFMQLPKNVTVVCGIDCPARIKSLCCQKR